MFGNIFKCEGKYNISDDLGNDLCPCDVVYPMECVFFQEDHKVFGIKKGDSLQEGVTKAFSHYNRLLELENYKK